MKNFFYYALTFLLFFSACKKDEPINPVSAGFYDNSFDYHEFSSPLKVELTFDSLTNNYFGRDSIDINQDGVYELEISHRVHITPPSGIPSFAEFPYYRVTLKNGLQVAIQLECYAVGMGQTDCVKFVDPLDYGSSIDKISKWSDSNTTCQMWVIPPIIQKITYGPWYNLTNAVAYVGIRMKVGKHYKLGWIKVNEISRENILFVSYALEK